MKMVNQWLTKYHIEKWVWCLLIAAFCWTDVADYYYMNNSKKACIWFVMGLYYVLRKFFLEKGNKLTAAGGYL